MSTASVGDEVTISKVDNRIQICKGEVRVFVSDADVKSELERANVYVSHMNNSWYQTGDTIHISCFKKRCEGDELYLACTDSTVSVCIQDRINNCVHIAYFNLFGKIVPDQVSTKSLPSKLDISAKKAAALHWSDLQICHEKNMSKANNVNWDHIIKQELEEEQECQDDVNALFEKVYKEGDDNIKKAMEKSFRESNGTVLSTNWEEVRRNRVEMKKPDCSEFKRW